MIDHDSTNGLIISLLSRKWPLKTSIIHHYISKHKRLTYQATHKALETLVGKKVLSKSKEGYSLDLAHIVKMRKTWEGAEASYKKSLDAEDLPNLIIPEANYLFEDQSIMIDEIPSVFISKSTFLEMIETLPKKELDRIAKKVAIKDYELIKRQLQKSEQQPTIFLKKLNELANEFYWGKVTFTQKDNNIEIKMTSFIFTTKKAKWFYERVYSHYMEILGYTQKQRNELTGIYTFEETK